MPRWTIERWIRDEQLAPLHRGVYALGHTQLRDEGWLAAALLATGDDAVISHETAAWWWSLRDEPPVRVHVSSPRTARSTHAIFRHRLRSLAGDDLDTRRGLPVTSVARTLLDVAATTVHDHQLRRLLTEAALAGYRVLRFTWREVVHQPDRVAGAIAKGLGVRAW